MGRAVRGAPRTAAIATRQRGSAAPRRPDPGTTAGCRTDKVSQAGTGPGRPSRHCYSRAAGPAGPARTQPAAPARSAPLHSTQLRPREPPPTSTAPASAPAEAP